MPEPPRSARTTRTPPRVRRVAVALAAAALAAVLVACDSGAATDDPILVDPIPDDLATGAPEPGGTTGGDGGSGAEFTTPRPGMVDPRPVAFEEAIVADDDRTITVFYWSGVEPCSVLDRVEVEPGETEVVITLFEGGDPEAQGVACIAIAQRKAVQVVLDEPVAGRDVVDGAPSA